MRDIIYRGKTKDGEWEYGGVVIYEKDAFIITKEDFSWSIMGDRGDYDGCITPVLPETVGQYTGLLDKDGKNIFEGDIVIKTRKIHIRDLEFIDCISEKGVVGFKCGCFALLDKYKDDKSGGTLFISSKYESYEVIGNIHDNPELLEVK